MGSHSDPVPSKPPPAPLQHSEGKFTYHCDDLVVHSDFCIKHIKCLWDIFKLFWEGSVTISVNFKTKKRGMLKNIVAPFMQTWAHSLTDGLVNWNINYCTALASVWEAPESVCTCWSWRIRVFVDLLTCRRKGLMLHSFRAATEGISPHRQQILAVCSHCSLIVTFTSTFMCWACDVKILLLVMSNYHLNYIFPFSTAIPWMNSAWMDCSQTLFRFFHEVIDMLLFSDARGSAHRHSFYILFLFVLNWFWLWRCVLEGFICFSRHFKVVRNC